MAHAAPAWRLLATISLPDWRAHPWRHAVALLAVALGVALAFSVHLINTSALSEFSAAVRAANGEPDLVLRCAVREGCDDRSLDRIARTDGVEVASPVVEIDTYALPAGGGARLALSLLGIDALQVAAVAPALLPRPAEEVARGRRTAFLDPDLVFLNPAALQRLGLKPGDALRLQHGLRTLTLTVAGSVAAGGGPLGVLDIAGAQAHFGMLGRLSRIDLRLDPGVAPAAWLPRLALPPDLVPAAADDAAQRVSSLSRAYRVNLTVLALVALFVGGFLVFSVLALSVAQRTPVFALLGVLGLSAAERQRLVRLECLLVGVVGSVSGLALGTLMAQAALRWLAGDLGGGYFPGVAPPLAFSWPAAAAFGALGVVAAMAGGWAPARQAAALAPAQALKGLGGAHGLAPSAWRPALLLCAGGLLALAPPVAGLPLAAYASVAALLLGGIACVPLAVGAVLALLRPRRSPLALLAVERARHERSAAAVAVAGVVASLSLAVALTVMVSSFREGVSQWLDSVLPADLYVRTAASSAASDQAFLPPGFVEAAAQVEGVARWQALRVRPMSLSPERPAVSLIARPLDTPAQQLPMIGAPRAPTPGETGVYVSEAMVALYGAEPGSLLRLPLGAPGAAPGLEVRVLGVWRDYARQFGAVAMDAAAYQRLTGDRRVNDLALWLAPGASLEAVQAALRAQAAEPDLIEFAVPAQIRAMSLAIFDRSFAVTRYLQALAIGIGLFGIAASFSAQVLARRREFGLLVHLGLTRAQVIGVVAGEGAAWTAAGALVGLALGLLVSVVLVHVVNPQSFHWTMALVPPWGRLAALCAAVLAAGSITAALSARAAASGDAVRAVKEDW
ncbi:FtsX-like permease family protein [Aquincola sp. MAHUQ-54]|uniref:FtsX-like permease family protein n=1 Tax=Aquincola agrisoli TaxID=3119538 RepID=A0AAW9QCG2_9BURK